MAMTNTVTKIPTSAAPDATGGNSLGGALAAAFISLYIVGPTGSDELVPGLQSLDIQQTLNGAGFQPQASTFRQERTLGARVFTAQGQRIQQRYRPIPVLIGRVYGKTSGVDIRLDRMPVKIVVQYVLVGPNNNYSAAIDTETRTYAECYFTVQGDNVVTSATGNAMESFTFESQNNQYTATGIKLVTAGFSSFFPKNPV